MSQEAIDKTFAWANRVREAIGFSARDGWRPGRWDCCPLTAQLNDVLGSDEEKFAVLLSTALVVDKEGALLSRLEAGGLEVKRRKKQIHELALPDFAREFVNLADAGKLPAEIQGEWERTV